MLSEEEIREMIKQIDGVVEITKIETPMIFVMLRMLLAGR